MPASPPRALLPSAPPSSLIFDLGGVLIDWNPRYLYRTLFDDAARMEHFLEHVCSPQWNAEQDAGRSWEQAVDELAAEHPHQRELIAAYWLRWQETLGDALHGTVALLAELKAAGVALYALTNWSAQTFPIARERFGFLSAFDDILVSGEEGLAKPDPRIFERALQRFGVEPSATLFIDDAAANVQAAMGRGIPSLLFRNADSLRASLHALGLPVAAQAPR
ncbi:HAD family hydrolase [Stenotrophomonas chelatiphaga]|uniref:HAD family hydrolase n=1 Tax=Stenotrophomonas chelatiphaga TaxID=517011 RepID=UPI00289C1725|nr:HAD family phosphatase [Stenotrophomonas chelatiphaga]